MKFLVLNMVVRVFLITVLFSYIFLWIINNRARWLKWDFLPNLLEQFKSRSQVENAFNVWLSSLKSWVLSLSCLSNRFYTGFNRFCTSLSLVSGHKRFVQLPRCSYVSPAWSRGPTAILQAFTSSLCIRLRLIAKTLKAKDNVAINIATSYRRLTRYGISRLTNVYAVFSDYLHLKIKWSSTSASRVAGLKISVLKVKDCILSAFDDRIDTEYNSFMLKWSEEKSD